MKFSPAAALGLVLLPVTLFAQTEAVGNWRAVFVGPIGERPKMVDAVTFSIKASPTGLTGTARASNWPGDLDVSDVKLEGNRLTFTGTGKEGWSTRLAGAEWEYHCCPKLMFDGTIQGDQMKLTLTWTSTESPTDRTASTKAMEANRVSKDPARH